MTSGKKPISDPDVTQFTRGSPISLMCCQRQVATALLATGVLHIPIWRGILISSPGPAWPRWRAASLLFPWGAAATCAPQLLPVSRQGLQPCALRLESKRQEHVSASDNEVSARGSAATFALCAAEGRVPSRGVGLISGRRLPCVWGHKHRCQRAVWFE